MSQTPNEHRFEITRQRILSVASSLLVEERMDAISIRALAEKVDYSRAALNKYLAKKIIEGLQQEAWDRMAAYEPEPPTADMTSLADISSPEIILLGSPKRKHLNYKQPD